MGGAFWVWSGASGEYMRKPVSHWSNSDVVNWVEGLGQWAQTNLTQVFINEVYSEQEPSYNYIMLSVFYSIYMYNVYMSTYMYILCIN